jgi:hypothetical protein
VEYVRAVFMHIYAVYGFGVDVAADMRTFVDYEAFLAAF